MKNNKNNTDNSGDCLFVMLLLLKYGWIVLIVGLYFYKYILMIYHTEIGKAVVEWILIIFGFYIFARLIAYVFARKDSQN